MTLEEIKCYYCNLSCYLLNIDHQMTLSNEETRNSAYFGATSYKSGLEPPPTMASGNLVVYSAINICILDTLNSPPFIPRKRGEGTFGFILSVLYIINV